MEQHADEVETLIIGNSFAMRGIIPDSLGKNAFNLAFAGEPLVYDHFLFFKWAERYRKLKTVIHTISYCTFYENSFGHVLNDILNTTYKIYLDCPFYSTFSPYNFESRHYWVVYEKLKREVTGLYDWTEAYHGWQPSPSFSVEKAPTFDRENKKYARQQTFSTYEQAEVNMQLIGPEASWCEEHGVRFILISPPHWKTFNSLLSHCQIEKNYELIHRLQEYYPLTYFDYREDDRFVESDFNDRMHLTVSGAKKFTEMLRADIRSIDND